MFIGRLTSLRKVKICCGRPSSSTVTSRWVMSLMTRLLESKALNRTFTSSVPSFTGSSLDSTGCCSCWAGAAEERGGGLGAGRWPEAIPAGPATKAASNRITDTFRPGFMVLASVDRSLFVVKVAAGANQFHLEVPFLATLFLVLRGIECYVFRRKVFGPLFEVGEQVSLMRGQENLPAGFFAESAHLFVVGRFNHAAGHAGEILGADAKDGDIISLGHVDGFFQRALACGVASIGQEENYPAGVGALQPGQFLLYDPTDRVVEARVAASLDLPDGPDQGLLRVGEVLMQLDG